jgi:hypothetical protein
MFLKRSRKSVETIAEKVGISFGRDEDAEIVDIKNNK